MNYYCYLLNVFPQRHPKQYLPYSIRQDIKKLNEYSEQVRFMATNKIETKEDLENFAKTNYEEYKNLMCKREIIWKRYRRAKTEEDKSEILAKINNIQPVIKELRKYDKYCKDIKDRSESCKRILIILIKIYKKKKTILGRYNLNCLFKFSINCLYFINSSSFSLICKT